MFLALSRDASRAPASAGLAAGFKGQVILPVTYLILAYAGATHRIPWRAAAAACAALLFAVVPVVNGLRNHLRQGDSIPVATASALTNVQGLRPDNALPQSERYLAQRLRLIDQIALIARDTPKMYPFAGGATYTPTVLLQAVPRAVWSDKPVLDQTTQYAHTYWQIPEDQHTATPMTQLGDLYRNFDWSGLMAGALALGLLLGAYQRLASQRETLGAEVVHVFVLASFVAFMSVETELPVLVGALMKTLPLALVVALLVFPLSLQGARRWLVRHKLGVAASAAVAVSGLGLGAYYRPLTTTLSPSVRPQHVVEALRSHGGLPIRLIDKPVVSAALWNVSGAYECRFGTGRVLVLDFDTSKATVQVTGRSRRARPGLVVQGSLVALYDPSRLDRRGIQDLRLAIRSAIE